MALYAHRRLLAILGQLRLDLPASRPALMEGIDVGHSLKAPQDILAHERVALVGRRAREHAHPFARRDVHDRARVSKAAGLREQGHHQAQGGQEHGRLHARLAADAPLGAQGLL